jgi:hypothetical protein
LHYSARLAIYPRRTLPAVKDERALAITITTQRFCSPQEETQAHERAVRSAITTETRTYHRY